MNLLINTIGMGLVVMGVSAAARYGIPSVREKWEGAKMLFEMNKSKHHSWKKALVTTVRTIAWVSYLMLYQKIYKNVVTIQKNVYDVHYVYHGQLYKIRCRHEMGPKKNQVLMIMNQSSEDVTKEIMSYLGPKGNFHHMRYTPLDLGHAELHFFLSDGTVRLFKKEETLVLDE